MAKPVLMYHLTTTGKDDSTLRSLFERQAITNGPQWVPHSGQRNGFYVNSSRAHTQGIGETPLDENDDPLIAQRPGPQVIVTVECDFGPGWDIDYEDNPGIGKSALFRFSADLEQAAPGAIQLSDGTVVNAIRAVEDDTRDGLELDVLPSYQAQPITVFMAWDKAMDADHLAMLRTLPTENFREHVREISAAPRISEYALLQALRDYLVETKGDAYLNHEQQVVRDAIDRENRKENRGDLTNGVSLKYSGAQPLKIIKLEMLGPRQRWDPITEPPAGTAPPEHI
ncbi:MAG: hypothetical protein KJ017_08900 [Alphaproteobacteria bacterium]|nr:hypothetical protein [Alphaproteobacteria bacterium]